MENCKDVFAALSVYLDRELPAASCEELEAHIAGCPPCIEFVESLKRSVGLCKGYCVDQRPEPMSAEVRSGLEAVYRKMLERRQSGQ